MTSEQETSPPTTQKPSATSYDDLPVVALLGKNPYEMTHEERVQFVTTLRSLRQPNVLKAKLAKEASDDGGKPVSKETLKQKTAEVQSLLDDLLKL